MKDPNPLTDPIFVITLRTHFKALPESEQRYLACGLLMDWISNTPSTKLETAFRAFIEVIDDK